MALPGRGWRGPDPWHSPRQRSATDVHAAVWTSGMSDGPWPAPLTSTRPGCFRAQWRSAEQSSARHVVRATSREGERVSSGGFQHLWDLCQTLTWPATAETTGETNGCRNFGACLNSGRGGRVILYSGLQAACFCMPALFKCSHIAGHDDVRSSQ